MYFAFKSQLDWLTRSSTKPNLTEMALKIFLV